MHSISEVEGNEETRAKVSNTLAAYKKNLLGQWGHHLKSLVKTTIETAQKDEQPLEELFQEVKKGGELVANKLRELEEKDTSTSEKGSVLVDKNVVELKGNEDTSIIDKKRSNHAMK